MMYSEEHLAQLNKFLMDLTDANMISNYALFDLGTNYFHIIKTSAGHGKYYQ